VLVADRRLALGRVQSLAARAGLVLPALAALAFIVLPLASTAAVRRTPAGGR